jgi:hypothetical protein
LSSVRFRTAYTTHCVRTGARVKESDGTFLICECEGKEWRSSRTLQIH